MEYNPIKMNKDFTFLEVKLITGKTHQIRAYLSSIGHPLIGDYKYGNRNLNQYFNKEYGLNYQLLHAKKLVFPKMHGEFAVLSESSFEADLPELFVKIFDFIF